jgi:hypothetical protein
VTVTTVIRQIIHISKIMDTASSRPVPTFHCVSTENMPYKRNLEIGSSCSCSTMYNVSTALVHLVSSDHGSIHLEIVRFHAKAGECRFSRTVGCIYPRWDYDSYDMIHKIWPVPEIDSVTVCEYANCKAVPSNTFARSFIPSSNYDNDSSQLALPLGTLLLRT